MLTHRTKWIFARCLRLSLLLFVFGCALLNRVDEGTSIKPVRRLRVTIDEGQRAALFDQFQKFAEKHKFRIQITDYGNRGEHFQVWMARDDIQIISEDVPGDSRVYSVDFLGKYPGFPVDEETVDELLNDLKSFIREVPNVTIIEE